MRTATLVACGLATLLCSPASGQEKFTVVLNNGMQLGPGIVVPRDSITTSSFQQGGGDAKGESILAIDDGLRVTYVNSSKNTVSSLNPFNGTPLEEIEFLTARNVATSGTAPSILGVRQVSKFNRFGRRQFAFDTARGRVDVLQAITLLTPVYASVNVLRGDNKFIWDQRISTTSIPAAKLREILFQALDEDRSGDWLKVVRFYIQMQRYADALEVIDGAVERFPNEMQQQKGLVTQIKQLYARQKFEEISLRRSVGQTELAAALLQQFPVETLAAETQLNLQREVEQLQQELLRLGELLKDLDTCVASLTPDQQQAIGAAIKELKTEVNLQTVNRLSDFAVLRADPSISKESLVAYAVGGWLLGGGAGIDNFAVAESLFRVRELASEYLNESAPQRRDEILRALRGEEGAQPQYVARLLATMKPPIESDQPAEGQTPGLYTLSVPGIQGGSIEFLVQTPPEYDPNQKYPCILALGGVGDSPELEINWWCGQQFEGYRYGQATRRGYIVVAPNWRQPQSYDYSYTELEHDRVLRCYREAIRRFSIDTARVFIAGHHDGGTAAWDIGVSHPSLWAGIVAISPGADKHLVHYSDNIAAPRGGKTPLGTYIVYGEYDGRRFSNQLGSVATEYLKNPKYESMVVEYRGNGSLRFAAEQPRIFEWLEIAGQRRLANPEARFPRQISARTMRSSDRFFYWLEAPRLLATTYSNPLNFDFKKSGLFDARILDGADNTIMINKIPSEPRNSAFVWLHPSMVDFDRVLNIRVGGKNNRILPEDMRPDIAIMLEDARTRGERQYVYWQRAAIR